MAKQASLKPEVDLSQSLTGNVVQSELIRCGLEDYTAGEAPGPPAVPAGDVGLRLGQQGLFCLLTSLVLASREVFFFSFPPTPVLAFWGTKVVNLYFYLILKKKK